MSERNPTGIRGCVEPVFNVHCGCANWETGGGTTRSKAAFEAKYWGWIFSRALGWVCPDCQAEGQEVSDE